jgi:hypothetical protein
VVLAVAALVVASACVPRPIGPSYNLVVSHRSLGGSPFTPGPWTIVQGTITNTGVAPADYTVELVSSSGETQPNVVLDVLVGQTAIWTATFDGDVTVAELGVTSTPHVVGPVPALAVITSQKVTLYADAPGPMTEIRGTVTNTGTTVGNFSIELQANTGEVAAAQALGVSAGQTVPWATAALGTGTSRIVRITTYHPHPTPPPAGEEGA